MAGLAGIGGQPGSIRSSGRAWSAFGASARTALTDISGVQTGEFVGDEGETYRGRISADLVPHLEVTAQAWEVVGTALKDYADGLEELQSRMASVQTAHAEQQPVVTRAWQDWQGSVAADLQHGADAGIDWLTGGLVDLDPNSDAYQSQSSDRWSAYQTASGDLRDIEARAAGIRSEHATLLQTCCGKIDQAKGLRPVDPPNWLQATGNFFAAGWNSAMDWVAENADVLRVISEVLSTISGIAGMLALIPCLTPIMAPIALVTGGASLLINVAVSAATGEWDLVGLGLQTLSLVPFIKPLAMAGRTGQVAARADTVFDWVSTGTDVASTVLTGVQTYQQTGDLGLAITHSAVSAIGTNIPGMGDDLGALQNIFSGAAGFTYDAGTMAYALATNPDEVSWTDWRDLALSGGSALIHGANGYNYQQAGTHPDGTPRGPFENASYVKHPPPEGGDARFLASQVADWATGPLGNGNPGRSEVQNLPDFGSFGSDSGTSTGTNQPAQSSDPAQSSAPTTESIIPGMSGADMADLNASQQNSQALIDRLDAQYPA